MSLYLTEQGIEHERVFLDTGWEHDLTYEYLREDLPRALGPITWISGPRLMEDLVRHRGMFPSRLRRFCTQELKVRPMIRHLRSIHKCRPGSHKRRRYSRCREPVPRADVGMGMAGGI